MATTAQEIFNYFESSFQDKSIIPTNLEELWLKKAIAQYNIELGDLEFDETTLEFSTDIDAYIASTLAQYMKVYYMEREVSKVNKRVSIVSKDISIDGNNGSKTAAKNELDYNDIKMQVMTANQKTPAYN